MCIFPPGRQSTCPQSSTFCLVSALILVHFLQFSNFSGDPRDHLPLSLCQRASVPDFYSSQRSQMPTEVLFPEFQGKMPSASPTCIFPGICYIIVSRNVISVNKAPHFHTCGGARRDRRCGFGGKRRHSLQGETNEEQCS